MLKKQVELPSVELKNKCFEVKNNFLIFKNHVFNERFVYSSSTKKQI